MSETPSRLPNWLYTFIPNREVKVTPVLISLNVVVFILMAVSGVDAYNGPTGKQAIEWGAANNPLVKGGEYWRLLTSNYGHYGILHLFMNMLALNNIGRGLEGFVGPWRFALIYTVTGIFASCVSIWWHPYSAGLGASGAICGVLGLLTALLTTNLIERTARKQMLRSIGLTVGLMVVLGISIPEIDNAAHFGGLLAGAICGYCIYPELRAFYYQRKTKYTGLIAAVVITAAAGAAFVWQVQSSSFRPAQVIYGELSVSLEELSTLEPTAENIDTRFIPVLEDGLRKMDTILGQDINPEAKQLFVDDRTRLEAGLKHYRYLQRWLRNKDSLAYDSAVYWKERMNGATPPPPAQQ